MDSESSNNPVPVATTTVRDIMTQRIVTVTMDDSLHTVRERFEQFGFHHLLVLEKRKLVGVISDRDLLRNLSPFLGRAFAERPQDLATLNLRVHQIMTRKPVGAMPEMPIEAAARLMPDQDISCLPVVNDRCQPVGIVTWKDLLRAMLGQRIPAQDILP